MLIIVFSFTVLCRTRRILWQNWSVVRWFTCGSYSVNNHFNRFLYFVTYQTFIKTGFNNIPRRNSFSWIYMQNLPHPLQQPKYLQTKIRYSFKSTSFSYIIFAFLFISSSLQNFVLSYWFYPIILFFSQTVNIPLIVCLSRKNNFENMAAARQRNTSLAWDRTKNQQWEIRCALEQRNQVR